MGCEASRLGPRRPLRDAKLRKDGLLALAACRVHFSKAAHKCGTVRNARDELHGAPRGLKHEGRMLLRLSKG